MEKKPPRLSDDKNTVEYDKNDFESALPNLSKELENKEEKDSSINNFLNQKIKEYHEFFPEESIENLNNPEELDHKNFDEIDDSQDINIPNDEFQIYSKPKGTEDTEKNSELINPTLENFIRRCHSIEEAEEIIEYLLKKKEITLKRAQEVKDKIHRDGLKSFGPVKTWGYYERRFRF